jgi:cholesterol oxidase
MAPESFDYDYVVVGSGFGGCVAAMRLTQKGYTVAVIETGRRYTEETYPTTNWVLQKSLWFPRAYLFGIWRISVLRHVAILGAAGVGGGSINYANTLYIPPDTFFENERVKHVGGKNALLPYYELAKKMLGVVENPLMTEVDTLIKETITEFGRESTFKMTPVAVYFGKEKVKAPDPYFMGEGPDRIGCEFCGGCMDGCRFNAKNTLDKNYLYFAEKFGAVVIPEYKVVSVKPLNEDGSDGYEIDAIKITRPFGLPRRKFRARSVVLSSGVLGTLNLLLEMKQKGILPRLSVRRLLQSNQKEKISIVLGVSQ